MASQTEEHIDPVDVLAAVVQVHHLLIRFDHAFVGLSGTIARLTHTFQRSQGIPNFFERDDFLEMRWPRLVVHVRPHQFTEACRVVQASATFFVAIASTYDNRPRSVHFILAKQVDPAIPSSGEWRRENCMIERGVNGRNRLHIPTELAVIATLRRLQPVFDYPEHEIAQGFTEGHPPPLPHDLLALHAECQVQLALDNLQCGSAGFLSRTAWQREVPRLMSAHEYAERSDRLRAIFMASTPASETGEKPLNRLVWEAAIMEADLCGAPADYASEEERNRAAKRHLAKLVLGWKDAVEMLGRLFSIPYPSVHDPLSRA
ncbi:proteophosphoglycan 5 [Rhodotorula toruloides]|uniref:Proteophosphoglycan 5 n=1 Tax=Rhodotorula toruloides TaxID=5286 RepID=A0A511KGA5_RHOTO|nr:proteophosphoglycan 5 [Rhodotorula toruloides]